MPKCYKRDMAVSLCVWKDGTFSHTNMSGGVPTTSTQRHQKCRTLPYHIYVQDIYGRINYILSSQYSLEMKTEPCSYKVQKYCCISQVYLTGIYTIGKFSKSSWYREKSPCACLKSKYDDLTTTKNNCNQIIFFV